ncbi:hypothetical protein MKQ70_19750 [Chitinophaga sedimenti]|uniref:hypothetical protein n=1 Tax=Chitinophaga sedimenti TaxID=2033606 RepID=UPI00200653CC|nr:hypothetical protein [Chitinophaga sedimenti]MCK7557116.1 hypothetical protein [Chitinophaga sedimenti]
MGLSNFYNEGIIKNTNFNRNGLRVNVSQKIGKIFTLSAGANYTLSGSNEIPNGGITEAYGALTGFIFANNYVSPYKNPVSGIYPSLAPTAILLRTNPLEAIDRFKFKQKVNRFIGNVQLNAKPIEGLNIDYVFGRTTTANYLPHTFRHGTRHPLTMAVCHKRQTLWCCRPITT